jgi:hypothetical protein
MAGTDLVLDVSTGIARDHPSGDLFPVVFIAIPGVLETTPVAVSAAIDMAINLMEGAVRSRFDLLTVRVLLDRGFDRQGCQEFLAAVKALDVRGPDEQSS